MICQQLVLFVFSLCLLGANEFWRLWLYMFSEKLPVSSFQINGWHVIVLELFATPQFLSSFKMSTVLPIIGHSSTVPLPSTFEAQQRSFHEVLSISCTRIHQLCQGVGFYSLPSIACFKTFSDMEISSCLGRTAYTWPPLITLHIHWSQLWMPKYPSKI